tara:strand:- start:123 stop:368 length:246 start_codon:yes stop_codon:yes gene_type:complete
MSKLQILKPQSIVFLKGDQNCEVRIEEVTLSGKPMSIEYKISWWNGGAKHCASVSADELYSKPNSAKSIGFINEDKTDKDI